MVQFIGNFLSVVIENSIHLYYYLLININTDGIYDRLNLYTFSKKWISLSNEKQNCTTNDTNRIVFNQRRGLQIKLKISLFSRLKYRC